MQETLFDEATQPTEAPAPPEKASPGEFYRDLFRRYCKLVDMQALQMQELSDYEQAESPCAHNTKALQGTSTYDIRKEKAELAKSMRDGLAFHASKLFAPDGTTLTIDKQEIYETLPIDEEEPEAYDHAKVWDYLTGRYGDGGGATEAWRQAAQKIIDRFYIKKDSQIKRAGNYMRLDLDVYLESIDKKLYNKNRLSYHCREALHELLAQLSSFAHWCHKEQLAADLGSMSQHYFGYGLHDYIESRKQLTCGDKGEVVIVTFTTRFEFRFRNDIAEQLQTFLGTYGTFKE